MPQFSDKSIVPYALDDMFNLVADVEKYPEFLPWCAGLRVKRKLKVRGKPVLYADMLVAYQVFREQFSSRVTLDRPGGEIKVEYLNGPFDFLENIWRFTAQPDGQTEVDFFIDFEFKNSVYQLAIEQVFDRAAMRLLDAFGRRSRELFTPVAGLSHPELPSDVHEFSEDSV